MRYTLFRLLLTSPSTTHARYCCGNLAGVPLEGGWCGRRKEGTLFSACGAPTLLLHLQHHQHTRFHPPCAFTLLYHTAPADSSRSSAAQRNTSPVAGGTSLPHSTAHAARCARWTTGNMRAAGGRAPNLRASATISTQKTAGVSQHNGGVAPDVIPLSGGERRWRTLASPSVA